MPLEVGAFKHRIDPRPERQGLRTVWMGCESQNTPEHKLLLLLNKSFDDKWKLASERLDRRK